MRRRKRWNATRLADGPVRPSVGIESKRVLLVGGVTACFDWRDDSCAAFVSTTSLAPGHTLVIPEKETAHWIDLDPGLAAHFMSVSQAVGRAVQESFEPRKVGLAMAGFEIPHAHVWPTHSPTSSLIDPGEEDPPEPTGKSSARRPLASGVRSRTWDSVGP